MKKDIKKDDIEWKIFMDVWAKYKDYAIPEEDEEYWSNLLKDMGAISAKYQHPLALNLAWAVCKALEEVRKNTH